MSEHTKGPLKICQPYLGNVTTKLIKEQYQYVVWPGHGFALAFVRKRADAQLYAVAHELFEALEAAEDCFTGHNLLSTATEAERLRTIENFLRWWNNVARLAVDKAKGE